MISKIQLVNLYLYHVLSFVNDDNKADEKIMRAIEFEAGISEDECLIFRKTIASHFKEYRVDFLYSKLGEIFEFLLQFETETIKKWLAKYPDALCHLWHNEGELPY